MRGSSATLAVSVKVLALVVSIMLFAITCAILPVFDAAVGNTQFAYNNMFYGMDLSLGIDGISLPMIYLTSFFTPLCILCTWRLEFRNAEYVMCILSIEILLLLVFTVQNLIWFYICFEAILIPSFVMIGIRGSRERKTHALYLLFFHTMCSSLPLLVGIMILYQQTGCTNYDVLCHADVGGSLEHLLWLLFFVAFAAKVPIYPFHIWLPEAHVESPTEGSVILAALLSKVGGYGLLRILLPIFPVATEYFSPLVISLCVMSVVFTSFATMRQVDVKRIIAYSSIAHMNIAVIGIFNLSATSLVGSVALMFGHGIVSGGLFIIVGMLYDRHKTKIVSYYSGLVHCMPILSVFLFIFVSGNIGMPSMCNFVGESIIVCETVSHNNMLCVIAICLSILCSAAYMLYMYNRIVYGLPMTCAIYKDLSALETSVLFILALYNFYYGIYPRPLPESTEATCRMLLDL